MIIQHNIMALNAHRQLGGNNGQVSKNLEKLSSGYRINRAGDDAAGLAISEKMRSQIKGLERAQANAQDGISLVQTAEGALTEVHSMLNRLVELGTESANGTIQASDRQKIQDEVDALTSEIDRISKATNFNGIKLLDGSLGGGSAAGGLTGAQIASFKGATTGTPAAGNDASATGVTGIAAKYEIDFSGTTAITTGVVDGVNMTFNTDVATTLNAFVTTYNGTAGKSYTASVDGNKLVLTAKTAGAVTTDPAFTGTFTGGPTAGNATETIAGVDTVAGINFNTTETIKVDGTDVKVDWSVLTDAERAALKKDWSATGAATNEDAKAAAKIMQDTINKAIDKQNAAKGTNIQHIKVEGDPANVAGTAVDNFVITSGQKDGDSSISFTGAADGVLGVTLGAAEVKTDAPVATLNFTASDVNNGKFTMSIGGQNVEVTIGTVTNATDLITQLNTALDTAAAAYDTAQGNAAGTTAAKINAKMTADGRIEIENKTGEIISFADKGDGAIAKTLGISAEGKAAGTGGLTLQIGDTAEDFNKVTVSVGDMSSTGLGVNGLKVTDEGLSADAITNVNKAVELVSTARGKLGALQNRLEHTINNLGVTTENMTAAESRIRDVDMAKEMMHFTKNNVLTQAAQAMLAQANQQPQQVLQLLR